MTVIYLILMRPFQHTATRRWLPQQGDAIRNITGVSTHSHPKVAAISPSQYSGLLRFQHTATRRWLHGVLGLMINMNSFNTQPPEGGCGGNVIFLNGFQVVSTHSHPKVAAIM